MLLAPEQFEQVLNQCANNNYYHVITFLSIMYFRKLNYILLIIISGGISWKLVFY